MARLELRVSDTEKAEMERLAEAKGVKLSEWVRLRALTPETVQETAKRVERLLTPQEARRRLENSTGFKCPARGEPLPSATSVCNVHGRKAVPA